MIKLVIFDLDDTLISEKQYVKSGYMVIAKRIKEDYALDDDEITIYNLMWELFEKNSKNVFNRLLDNLKLTYDKNYIKELIKKYREHSPKIYFYNDVVPCLKYLKNKNIKLGIISDGYLITQKNKLKVLKSYELFDMIILTDELGREYWKPSPKSFEMMKDYFNVNYEEILYVGDNPQKDFYIKKYYPIVTTRIYREDSIYLNEEYIDDVKEDYKINNLEDICEIIKKI